MYMRAGDMTKSEFLNCSFGHRGNYLTLIRVNEVIKMVFLLVFNWLYARALSAFSPPLFQIVGSKRG